METYSADLHRSCTSPAGVCDRGVLAYNKTYRMSTQVVVIGFILLIPSVIGILVGGVLLSLSLSHTKSQGQQEEAPGSEDKVSLGRRSLAAQ